MKSINLTTRSAKVLAIVSLKLGKMSADSACCYIFHQPQMPEALKRMKKYCNMKWLSEKLIDYVINSGAVSKELYAVYQYSFQIDLGMMSCLTLLIIIRVKPRK